MSTKVFITIDQGATLDKIIHRVRTTMGVPVDLSSQTGSMLLKKNYNANSGYQITVSLSNTGEVRITATANTTASIPQGRYVYDVLGNANGTFSRICEGYASVAPAVTE